MPQCKQSPQPLKATHTGVLHIGGAELPCYVLNNGTRVLSQQGMLDSLAMSRGDGGERLATFVAQKRLKPFVSNKLTAGSTAPIRFIPVGGGPEVYGYEATVLADLCTAVLAASAAGCLQRQQQHIARQAVKLLVSFAKTGIVGMVDEATGYQYVRAPDALQSLLARMLRDEPGPRVKRFSDAFYDELYRITGMERRGGNHPFLFAALTRDLIYRRLGAPGLIDALETRNPLSGNGGRRARHHQFLSEDVGVETLIGHLGAVLALMKLANSLKELRRLANISMPRVGDTLSMPFMDGMQLEATEEKAE